MPDRTKAPPEADILLPKVPEPKKTTLNGGYPLFVIDQGTQPVLVLEIDLPVGRWSEPKPGLTYFAAKMLTEGTPGKTSEQIAAIFDFYGSHMEITPTMDAVHIKLYALKKFFPELVRLLASIMRDANHPEKEFNIIRQIRVQQIHQQHAKNNAFAELKFREMLFGENHPYGVIINDEKVRDISPEDVRSFHSTLLSDPTFYLAGMVSDEDISTLQSAFNEVSFGSVKTKSAEAQTNLYTQHISREGSTQASLRLGHFTITRHHKDTHQLKITNTLLGGYFGSRLMKNIREKRGLTYGIHSSIAHLINGSYWHISTEVLKEKLDLARKEIEREVEKLQNKTPSEEELSMVTNYMKGKFLTSFDTPFNSLNMIKNLHNAGLDTKYYHDFLDTLNEITPEDVTDTARKYLGMREMITLSVA